MYSVQQKEMLLLFLFTWHNSAHVASFCFRMEMLLPERALSKIAVTIIILETKQVTQTCFPASAVQKDVNSTRKEECSWKQKSQDNCSLQEQDNRISILRPMYFAVMKQVQRRY